MVGVNSFFNFLTEMTDQTLDGPGSSITQGTNGMPFNLASQLINHVNFGIIGSSLLQSFHDINQPGGAFTARGALAATFMLIKLAQAQDRVNDIRLLVDHNHSGCAQATLRVSERVKVHQHIVANFAGQKWHRGTSRNHSQEIIPAALHATTVAFEEFFQRDRHFLLHSARIVHVAGNTEKFRAAVIGSAERGEPIGSAPHDRRANRYRFYIGHGGGAAVESRIGGEGRLDTGLARLAFQRLNQTCFFTADVGSGTRVYIDIEVVATVRGVLSQEPFIVGLLHSLFESVGLVPELTAYVDVSGAGAHGETDHQGPFDQFVRVIAEDLAILAGAWLGLIRIDDQVGGTAIGVLFGHEGIFQSGGKTGAATAAQPGLFNFVDDPIGTHREYVFGLVPVSSLHGTLDAKVAIAIYICKYTITVF